eukprot:gb/GECG01013744.1/.p1 GENE.gb/GECG01013744.1/~~gb/GECG01013744.1/.p1  ORF type:complete len:1516 (+),score=207.82 gb/GECG01013744.1/:1-4548(+)
MESELASPANDGDGNGTDQQKMEPQMKGCYEEEETSTGDDGEYTIEHFYEDNSVSGNRGKSWKNVTGRYNGSGQGAPDAQMKKQLSPTLTQGKKFVSEFDHRGIDPDHEYSGSVPEGSEPTFLASLGHPQGRDENGQRRHSADRAARYFQESNLGGPGAQYEDNEGPMAEYEAFGYSINAADPSAKHTPQKEGEGGRTTSSPTGRGDGENATPQLRNQKSSPILRVEQRAQEKAELKKTKSANTVRQGDSPRAGNTSLRTGTNPAIQGAGGRDFAEKVIPNRQEAGQTDHIHVENSIDKQNGDTKQSGQEGRVFREEPPSKQEVEKNQRTPVEDNLDKRTSESNVNKTKITAEDDGQGDTTPEEISYHVSARNDDTELRQREDSQTKENKPQRDSFSSLLSDSSQGSRGKGIVPTLRDFGSSNYSPRNSRGRSPRKYDHVQPKVPSRKATYRSRSASSGSPRAASVSTPRSASRITKGQGRNMSGFSQYGSPKGRRASFDHIKHRVPSRRASSPRRNTGRGRSSSLCSMPTRRLSYDWVGHKVPSRTSKYEPPSRPSEPRRNPAEESRKQKRRSSVDFAFGRNTVFRRLSLTKRSGYYSQLPVSERTEDTAGGTNYVHGHLIVPTNPSEALEALSNSIDFKDIFSVYSDRFLRQIGGRKSSPLLQTPSDTGGGRNLWKNATATTDWLSPSQRKKRAEAISHKPSPFGPGFNHFNDAVRKAAKAWSPQQLQEISATEINSPARGTFLQDLVDKSWKHKPSKLYNFVQQEMKSGLAHYQDALGDMPQEEGTKTVELALIICGPGFGLEFCAPRAKSDGSKRKGAVLSKISKLSPLYQAVRPGSWIERVNGTRVSSLPFDEVLTKLRWVAATASASKPHTICLRVTKAEKRQAEVHQVRNNYTEALKVYRDSIVWEELNRDVILQRGRTKDSNQDTDSRPGWNPTSKIWSFNRKFWEVGTKDRTGNCTGSKLANSTSLAVTRKSSRDSAATMKLSKGNLESSRLSAGLHDVTAAWDDVSTADGRDHSRNVQHGKSPQLYGVFEPLRLPTRKRDIKASVLASTNGEYIDLQCCSVPIGIRLQGKSGTVHHVISDSLADGLVFPEDQLVRIGSVDLRDSLASDIPAILQAACQYEKEVSKDAPLLLRFWRSFDSPHSVLAYASAIQSYPGCFEGKTEADETCSESGRRLTVDFYETPLGIIARKNVIEKVQKHSPAAHHFRPGDRIVQVNRYYTESNFQNRDKAIKIKPVHMPSALKRLGKQLAMGDEETLKVTVLRGRDDHSKVEGGELKEEQPRESVPQSRMPFGGSSNRGENGLKRAALHTDSEELLSEASSGGADEDYQQAQANESFDKSFQTEDTDDVFWTHPTVVPDVIISPAEVSDEQPRQELRLSERQYCKVTEIQVPFTQLPLGVTFSESDVCYGTDEPHFSELYDIDGPLPGIFVHDISRESPAFGHIKPGAFLKKVNGIDTSRCGLQQFADILKLSECKPSVESPLVLFFYQLQESTPVEDRSCTPLRS